jgi:hypothetical protein
MMLMVFEFILLSKARHRWLSRNIGGLFRFPSPPKKEKATLAGDLRAFKRLWNLV